ncbi:hypothetical protein [Segatella copri]|nr:hypothetical protein [Segatella copri]
MINSLVFTLDYRIFAASMINIKIEGRRYGYNNVYKEKGSTPKEGF